MSASIVNFDKTNLAASGKVIMKSNEFMRDLATVMEHPEFKTFIDKYFKDFSDIQSMIVMIKLYQAISTDVSDPFEKVAMLQKIMSNSELRGEIFDNYHKWRNCSLGISSENPRAILPANQANQQELHNPSIIRTEEKPYSYRRRKSPRKNKTDISIEVM